MLLFSGAALAGDSPAAEQRARRDICLALRAEAASPEELAKRGCCSWHGGVCGCSGGRVVCCDGSFSPSCTCRGDGPTDDGPPAGSGSASAS
jgi:hypothetical protein